MYKRNCPVCNEELVYSSECVLSRALKNNSPCRSCSKKGRTLSDETKKKIGKSNTGKIFSDERKLNISKSKMGHTVSDDTRVKIGKKLKGKTYEEIHGKESAILLKQLRSDTMNRVWNTTRIKLERITKICEICNNEFITTGKERRFCSVECQNKWQGRNKIKFICKICNQEFEWSPSRIKQANPTYCSLYCRDQDEDVKNRLIHYNVLQSRKKGLNKLEREGRKILEELGVVFVEQELIANKFLVDVLIPDKKIIIQWDGDYWHGKKRTNNKLDDRQIKRMNLDKSQDAYMTKCGYKILRFWETDIYKNRKDVYDIIRKAI